MDVQERWTACFRAAGYDAATPPDASSQVTSRLVDLRDQGLLPDRSLLKVDPATGTYTENSLVGPELAALQEFEIALETAVADCDVEIGLSETERRVRYIYELGFVEQHTEMVENARLPVAPGG